MKITVELDKEQFDRALEKIRMCRQMKNGRAVDAKAAKAWFINHLQLVFEESWDYGLDEAVERYIDQLDDEMPKQPLGQIRAKEFSTA